MSCMPHVLKATADAGLLNELSVADASFGVMFLHFTAQGVCTAHCTSWMIAITHYLLIHLPLSLCSCEGWIDYVLKVAEFACQALCVLLLKTSEIKDVFFFGIPE